MELFIDIVNYSIILFVFNGSNHSQNISTPLIQRTPTLIRNVTPVVHFSWNKISYSWFTYIIHKIIQNFRFRKTCLSRYDVMMLHLKIFSNILIRHRIYKSLYISYVSKSSKTKPTDLHYISDKNHVYSKLCQKVIILKVWEKVVYMKLLFLRVRILEILLLYSNEDMHNYTILLNWENERASIQFNVLKLNPPSTSYFD